jgi:RHS repeat-associated protein
VNLAYDNSGRLNTLTLARGVTTYNYSQSTGQLGSITAPDGGGLFYGYSGSLLTTTAWNGQVAGTVARAYNNDLRVTSLSVNGVATTFSYDADTLLTQAGDLTLTRDPSNGVITATALGNQRVTLSYNGFWELTGTTASYNTTLLLGHKYNRDQLGRITQKVETLGGADTTVDYVYDLAGRLAQVKQNGTTTATYTYDSNSNRLSVDSSGGMTNASYDSQDRLIQYGSVTYTYSAAGELQSKRAGTQLTTYEYDEVGNLLSVRLPDDTLITYVIDGQNRRIGKKVGGSLLKGFLYQDQLRLVAELDGHNIVVSRFIYGSRSNAPDYMIKNGATYRLVHDQLGSPRLVVDVATGAIVQRLDYDEFGQVTQDTKPGFQPFGFAGGLYDPDTKLVRFGLRDYDAETGRWAAKDPLRFDGGDANLYGYALSDPVNRIDPSGQAPSVWGKVLDTWRYLELLWDLFHGKPKLPPKPPPPPPPVQPPEPIGPPPPPEAPPCSSGGIVGEVGGYLTVIGSRFVSILPPIPVCLLPNHQASPECGGGA